MCAVWDSFRRWQAIHMELLPRCGNSLNYVSSNRMCSNMVRMMRPALGKVQFPIFPSPHSAYSPHALSVIWTILSITCKWINWIRELTERSIGIEIYYRKMRHHQFARSAFHTHSYISWILFFFLFWKLKQFHNLYDFSHTLPLFYIRCQFIVSNCFTERIYFFFFLISHFSRIITFKIRTKQKPKKQKMQNTKVKPTTISVKSMSIILQAKTWKRTNSENKWNAVCLALHYNQYMIKCVNLVTCYFAQ